MSYTQGWVSSNVPGSLIHALFAIQPAFEPFQRTWLHPRWRLRVREVCFGRAKRTSFQITWRVLGVHLRIHSTFGRVRTSCLDPGSAIVNS